VYFGRVQNSTKLSITVSTSDLHLEQEHSSKGHLDKLIMSRICGSARLLMIDPHFRCFLKFSARKKISRQRSAASLAKKASSRCSRGSYRQPLVMNRYTQLTLSH
jgi:hypothetical protein